MRFDFPLITKLKTNIAPDKGEWKGSQLMKRFYGLVAMGLILGLMSGASAHIGEQVFLLFEIADEDIGDLDFTDGTIEDWEDVVGDPQFFPTDFYQDPTVADGAQYDPADLDYLIWMGWNATSGTVWFAIERIDNAYFGREYSGNSPWFYEGVELMLDGDHTGGDYTGWAKDWTDEERKLNNNRTAQQYFAVADDPSGRHVSYSGAGEWVTDLPYADGGGVSVGDGPTVSIIEFFCTPFDDLIWNSPDTSVPSSFFEDKVIGLQISIPDTDQGPGQDRAFHTLSGQAVTWRYAERFVDFRLVGAVGGTGSTAVEGEQAIAQTLAKVSGDGQEGTAGLALAAPFVVSVLDEDDEAVAGVVVTFSVTAGEGILSATTATTDVNGQATTTLTLTLGSDAETIVEATVEGLESVTFTATAIGQATLHSLAKVSGDGQEGTVGDALPEPFIVSVSDEDGKAIAGAVVTFSVTTGGGTLSATTAITDANGRARSTLTLGSDAGINTVSATIEGLESETFTATAIEQTPHSLAKVSGDGQEGTAGLALAAPFVVSVLDEDDEAVAGVVVTFAVTAGEGILSATTATTDVNGQATTTLTLILGSDTETNTVSATIEGLEPVTFTATAIGQAIPDSLAKVSGDGQEGTVGDALPEPFVVSVSDEDGKAIAGAVVTFSVTTGGGTLSATTAITDANGRARSTLTLGSDAGTNTVTATVEGLESVIFTTTGQDSSLAGFFDAFFGSGKRVALPDSPQLAQNAPNPFNSQTVISYFLDTPGPARLEVFALSGQRVTVLHQGPQQAGYHRLRWNGRDDAGHPVASGMYLYRLVTNEGVLTRKLVLLR